YFNLLNLSPLEEKKWTRHTCICGVSADKMPTEVVQGCGSRLTEELQESEKLSDELKELIKVVSLLVNDMKEERKPSFWTRCIKIINRVYFILYVTASSLFLCFMFAIWTVSTE
ncbi:hypothetical protein XENOCAPTIV_009121, partial [Xenoophorus captivus]